MKTFEIDAKLFFDFTVKAPNEEAAKSLARSFVNGMVHFGPASVVGLKVSLEVSGQSDALRFPTD
ncbi:MAG: hypothetical protein AAGF48_14910 [Pseudomonadota bacterium]